LLHLLFLLLQPALVTLAQAEACVGVVPAGGSKEYWRYVEAGAESAVKGSGLSIYFRGPGREDAALAQAKIIDMLVERGCKAVVVAPVSAQIADSVAALNTKGIPVIYIDRDMGGDVAAVIATDNFHAGVLAGEQMVAALHGAGGVAIMRKHADVQSTTLREEGFIQAVRAGGLEIVFEGYLEPDSVKTLADFHAVLSRVDGVFAPNDVSVATTLAALRRAKTSDRKVLIGFDSSPLLIEGLEQGWIHGLVVQQPYAMGYQSVKLALQLISGQPLAKPRTVVSLPVSYVTRENMQSPEIARLLQPQPASSLP
jgi:ribose transport system substrate-binding protein